MVGGLLVTTGLAAAAVPTVSIDDVSPSSVNAEPTTVTFSADQRGDYVVVLSDEDAIDCSSGVPVGVGSGAYTAPAATDVLILASELAEGENTIRVCVTNAEGETGSDFGLVTKDTRPETVLDGAPPEHDNSTSARFAFSSPTPLVVGFECSLYGASLGSSGFVPCNSGSVEYADLEDGTYVFTVRAVNSLEKRDLTPATWVWVRDSVAPRTSILAAPSGTTDARSIVIEFLANEAGASFECKLNDGPYVACQSPRSYAGFADGTQTVWIRATDKAGNVDSSPAQATWTVAALVATPAVFGAEVRKARVRPGDHRATITWARPRNPNFRRVEIVRMPGRKGAERSLVYRGNKTRFLDRGLKNGSAYTWLIYAIGKAGNRSAGVELTATPPVRVKLGSKVKLAPKSPIVFWWKPVRKARFYNVQLFRGSTKVLSSWPSKPSVSLADSWNWEGGKRKLSAGKYRWFVWPGFGRRANAEFGKLVGSGKLVVKKSAKRQKRS